mgnify:CR=1 FL=1
MDYKAFLFVGDSFTWGQGLYYYSKYDSLKMNPYSTHDSVKFKSEMARKYHNAVLAIDNDEKARAAYRAEGIKTLHPNALSEKTLQKYVWNGIFN